MPTYDAANFAPPAPVAEVTLRDPIAGTLALDVALLIDTGADVTLLPRAAVERLGIDVAAAARIELASFDGSRSFAPVVLLEMQFLGRAYRGNYVVSDAPRGVLGRDVLNHVMLLLDGPQQRWSQASP